MAKTTTAETLWFKVVSRGGRKSCPGCRRPLADGERIWAWREYSKTGKARHVRDFCRECFPEVLARAWEVSPTRAKEIRSQGAPRPAWMRLEPDYQPDLRSMLGLCTENPLDFQRRFITSEAALEVYHHLELSEVLRHQAHAIMWALRTGQDLRQFFVVSRTDWNYGRCPRKRVPYCFFVTHPTLQGIIIGGNPAHKFGFETLATLEGNEQPPPSQFIYLHNGGWHHETDSRYHPFPVNYCQFIQPLGPDLLPGPWPHVYPKVESDAADGKTPIRVWVRAELRFELYSMGDRMPGSSHVRIGYRLYRNDELLARAFDIGHPPFGTLADDDDLLGCLRWAERSPDTDAVALNWDEDNRYGYFTNFVHELDELYNESRRPGGESWHCPAYRLAGHSVLDCEACYNNYAQVRMDEQNAQHAQPM